MRDYTSIFILSDSIGETGEFLVNAATVQFDKINFQVERQTHITSVAEIEDSLLQARKLNAMIAYTIVKTELLAYLQKRTGDLNLLSVDLINPLITAISTLTGQQPLALSGLNRKTDSSYFSRMEAIEFAVKFDDGKNPYGLTEADVVIIGLSRSSKTPLCMYLASYHGVKAANVPLVMQSPLPDELFKLPAGKVVGLTVRPEKLQEIRKQRLKIMGLPPNTDYTVMAKLWAECEYANSVMNKIGCPVVDTTDKAIEETAANIMAIFRKRKE
ncbi:MAG: kinase/pyrophosphorylase [Sporomusaceae bacterium]|nr:kinase/pyrophosphorylase [Sporomusaceae bacterium]